MQPPARKQPLASNSDFRKLLETPRPGRGGDGSIPTKGRAQLGGDSQKPKKKSRPKPVKEEAEDEGPQYRQVPDTQDGSSICFVGSMNACSLLR